MAKLGDLFIELGVAGDVKELEDAVNKMKEQVSVTQRQVRLDEARAKALEKIRQAQTKADKQRIAKAYNNEKTLIMQEAEVAATQRQIGAKRALGGELAKLVTGFAAFVGAVAGAAYALNRLTNELVQSNQAFLDLTRTSDISLQTFQEWDSVGKMFGVQNAAQEISNLNDKLFDLMLTGEGARGFQLAGIDPRGQNAEGVMEQLRDRVSTLNDNSASYLLRQMGIDPKMLHLLRIERDEFKALGEEVKKYQLTPDQRKDIQLMNVQLQIAAQKLQYLKQRAILALMPVFVRLVKSFARVTEMLMRWGKAIKNANGWWRGFMAAVAWRLVTLAKVQAFFKGISTALGSCIAKIPIFGKLFASLGGIFAKALLPLTLLYLLLDDLAVYFEGGDSLIGRVINWGSEKGAEISDAFKKMFGGDFGGGFMDLSETLKNAITDLVNVIDRLADIIANFFSFGAWNKIKNSKAFEPIKDVYSPSPVAMSLKVLNKTMEALLNFLKNQNEGQVAGGAAPFSGSGYVGTLPDISHNAIVSPATEQSINNNSVSNSNSNTTNITQNIEIQTNQPAQDSERELRYVASRYAYQ